MEVIHTVAELLALNLSIISTYSTPKEYNIPSDIKHSKKQLTTIIHPHPVNYKMC